MQLTQNRNSGEYSIQSYTPGEIRINNICYTHSIILSPHQIIEDWPPQNISALESKHLDAIIQLNPEVVLLGTGKQQHFLSSAFLADLIARNIGFEIMHTLPACRTFNLLAAENRKVVAGLIIT